MKRPELWTPPQARTLPRARVPEGDVVLAGNRRLQRITTFAGDPGLPTEGARWAETRGRRVVMTVIATMDDTPHGRLLHVSLARPDRLPAWADVQAVREAFFPQTVDAMMVLPGRGDYVNVHEFCFHLWQTPVGWGLR